MVEFASTQLGPHSAGAVAFVVGCFVEAGERSLHVGATEWKIKLGLVLNECVFCGFKLLCWNGCLKDHRNEKVVALVFAPPTKRKSCLNKCSRSLFVLAIAGDFPPCHSGVAAANVNKPLVSLVGRDATVDDV